MKVMETAAPWVGEHRQPVDAGNPWLAGEQAASRMISGGLEAYRRWRDETQEAVFAALFG